MPQGERTGPGKARLIARLDEMRRAGTISEQDYADRLAAIAERHSGPDALAGEAVRAASPAAPASGHRWRPSEVLLIAVVALVGLGAFGLGLAPKSPAPTGGQPAGAAAATATPEPTAFSRTWTGQAHAQGQGISTSVTLPKGDYAMEWEITTPFDDEGLCGITAQLFNRAGEFAAGEDGVSETFIEPASNYELYRDLEGTYSLQIYVGCPWTVTLVQR